MHLSTLLTALALAATTTTTLARPLLPPRQEPTCGLACITAEAACLTSAGLSIQGILSCVADTNLCLTECPAEATV